MGRRVGLDGRGTGRGDGCGGGVSPIGAEDDMGSRRGRSTYWDEPLGSQGSSISTRPSMSIPDLHAEYGFCFFLADIGRAS